MLPEGSLVDGRFEVEAMVGEGGMAEVYRVRHRELGRVMALKLLTWRKKSLVERLVLEGRIQAQLTHPNIVAVVDLVRHEGQVGLLMEYIQDAETLDDVLDRQGALPVDEALELIAPVLGAVGAAHAVGVTHRDLKPANVMLARVGSGFVPKVTDFGIAKVVDESSGRSTRAGATMGTPGYLAPEQVRDASTIDGRADVFALGAIAYELLTGRQAFLDAQGEITVASTLEVEPRPLGELVEVPLNVVEAVHRAMAKDAAERFATCEAFAEALLAHRPELLAALRQDGPTRALSLSGPTHDPEAAQPSTLPPASSATLDVASLPPTLTGGPSKLPWLVAGGLAVALLLVLVAGGGGALIAAGVLQSGEEPVEVATVPPEPAPVVPPVAPVAAPAPADPVPDGVGADVAAVAPEPSPVAPSPSPSVAPSPSPSASPVPAPAASGLEDAPEGGEAEPEPETAEAPMPAPEPAAAAEPEPEPEPAPAPAPEPVPVALPDVTGTWKGTAGRQPIELELSSDASGAVTGAFTIAAGATTRRETLEGRIDAGGGLKLTGGGFVFEASLAGDRLSGRYMARNKKWIDWSVER